MSFCEKYTLACSLLVLSLDVQSPFGDNNVRLTQFAERKILLPFPNGKTNIMHANHI